MSDFIIFLPLTFLYLILKSTLFSSLPVPDLPLLIVFYMAYRKPSIEGAALAFILGYIDDAFSGGVIGSTSFCLIFIYAATRLSAGKVQFSTPFVRAGGAGIAEFVKGVLMYAVLRLTGLNVHFSGWVFLDSVITAAFAPAIITLFTRLKSLAGRGAFKDNVN